MKHTTLTSRTLLGLALLGTLAATPSLTRVANADAPDMAQRDDRTFDRDDHDGDRDNTRRDGKDVRRDKAGRAEKFEGRAERGPRRRGDIDRAAGHRGDRGERADFNGRDNQSRREGFGRYGGNRDENSVGRDRTNRPEQSRTIAPQFTGVVSKVKSDREFDVRIDGKTYNVYLLRAAGTVRVGQTVGLNGERIGNNDIRSASLSGQQRR